MGDEIIEALDEFGWDPPDLSVLIDFQEDADDFTGWSAEIIGPCNSFTTKGFEDRDDLIAELKVANIEEA